MLICTALVALNGFAGTAGGSPLTPVGTSSPLLAGYSITSTLRPDDNPANSSSTSSSGSGSSQPTCSPTALTLLNVTGTAELSYGSTGLVRFTGGQSGNFTEPLAPPASDADRPITALYLTVGTGGQGLRGGDSANAVLNLASDMPVHFTNINNKADWGNWSTSPQIGLLGLAPLPSGTTVGDLTSFAVQTDLPGGLFGDNWDVASLHLWAELGCPSSTSSSGSGSSQPTCSPTALTLLNVTGTAELSDGSTGLVRFTGGQSGNFTEPLAPPASDADRPITALYLTVGTGGQGLRGGDSANAVLNLASDMPVHFTNINNKADWGNWSTSPQIGLLGLAPLPSGTTVGDLTSFAVQTDLPGGLFGDNWDVASLHLWAELGCPSSTSSGPPPQA